MNCCLLCLTQQQKIHERNKKAQDVEPLHMNCVIHREFVLTFADFGGDKIYITDVAATHKRR